MPRTLAYKPNESMTSVYEVIQERECDPHPGKYSLWCTGNGAIHAELRNYEYRKSLIDDVHNNGYKTTIVHDIENKGI
jgi:hypothetical protein